MAVQLIERPRVNAAELRRQMAARGLTAQDLIKLTGRSPATISRAMSGHVVTALTLRLVVAALEATPVNALGAKLIGAGDDQEHKRRRAG